MTKYLASFNRHHSVEVSSNRAFVESEGEALVAALRDCYGLCFSPDADPSVIVEQAKAGKDQGTVVPTFFEVFDDGKKSFQQDENVVVWHKEEHGKTNFGIGHGSKLSDTDKHENIWITLKEWEPSLARKAELESLSKEELVSKFLMLEALHGL